MRRRVVVSLLVILGLAVAPVAAQDDFYRRKTMRIIVGFSAGGGFDTFARTFARPSPGTSPGPPP